MTTGLMESYSNIFEDDDATSSSGFDASRSMMGLSKTNSEWTKRTKNDDSLECFLAENIACYESVPFSSVYSASSSVILNEGNSDSGVKESLVIENSDTDNDVEIPDDCRNHFMHLMDEMEASNRKIKYVMDINKNLQEEVETINFTLNREREKMSTNLI